MMTRMLAAALLIVASGQGEANGQATATPAGGKSTLTPFLVRDAQGKMVPMPDPNPAKPVNYVKWINETIGGGIKDNAADLYEAAYKLYPKTDIKPEDLDKALAGPWDNLPNVAAWLKANQACLDKFKEATKKRQCFFRLLPQDSTPGSNRTPSELNEPRVADSIHRSGPPPFGAHHRICMALLVQGWRAWRQGDEAQIIENALAVLRSAHHLDDQLPSKLNRVGIKCAGMSYDALVMAMSLSRDADATAERLAARLSVADPPLDLKEVRGLSFEYAMLRDVCQRAFAPGNRPGTLEVSKGYVRFLEGSSASQGAQPKPVDVGRLAQVGYEPTLREFDTVTKVAQGWIGKPHSVFLKGREALGRAVVGSESPLIELITPDLAPIYEWEEKRIASRRATHMIAHLLVYHGKNHVFPSRLDELSTPDLKELRIDPFSGKDFVYKRKDNGFTLYSVGLDLKDDGGQHDDSWEKGDFVFWPVQP